MSAVSYAVWGLILAAALTLWSLSHRQPDSAARPADVIGWLAAHPVWRVVLVAGWMFLGWHIFAR